MPNIFLRQDFSPSCPSGGKWYACGTGSNFVGCCRSEPCENGCPTGNLEPASFDPNWYGKFPDQECPSGSLWYTCQLTDPPFMGCCKSSPCGGACPAGDLTAAFLSSNPKLAGPFSPSPALSTASETASSSSSSSTTTSQTSSTGTSTPLQLTSTPTSTSDPADPYEAHHPTSMGVIVGSVIGGVLVIVILLLLFYFRRKQTNKRKANSLQPSFRYNDNNPGTEVGYQGLKQDSPNRRETFPLFSLLESKLMPFHRDISSNPSPDLRALYSPNLSLPSPIYSPSRERRVECCYREGSAHV